MINLKVTIFTVIDLWGNKLIGEIPYLNGKFKSLKLLYLTGNIEQSLRNLINFEAKKKKRAID